MKSYVFLSSPGESDKPDVRNGFVLSLDNLWCPLQDKAPSSPWETAKGNRTSSCWTLYQLKPELGALWVLKAVYLEIEVGLLFCLWASKHVFYTHMYPNTGNIYIYNQPKAIINMKVRKCYYAISKREPLFQSFRKHHMWWIHSWGNISTFIVIEQKATGCIILLICFTRK